MRAHQFWIVMLVSLLVSALMIEEVYLSSALTREQMVLVAMRDVVSTSPGYENAWKQLAFHIYQAGRQDPALIALLKSEQIDIHPNTAADAGSPPATTPPTSPPSSKDPVSPLPPAAP
jgi:hypothetical protein